MTYDQDDLDSIALCAWKEARGEGTPGMLAVMHVIYNRALAWYGGVRTEGQEENECVHHAVYAKNQFTSMSVPSDTEFNLRPGEADASFEFCQQVAPRVLAGQDADITSGALYYANLHHVTSGWFIDTIVNDPANHPRTATIGRQTFFR
jgi:spore germination cell wall hydrolase CwlJ-like protein